MEEGGVPGHGPPGPSSTNPPRGVLATGFHVEGMSPATDEVERSYMLRALRLAERGRGRTSPNPIVGAGLVRGGRVVGEGWPRGRGAPRAGPEAVGRAGPAARRA